MIDPEEDPDYFRPGRHWCPCGTRVECSSWKETAREDGVVVVSDIVHECHCGRRATDYLWDRS